MPLALSYQLYVNKVNVTCSTKLKIIHLDIISNYYKENKIIKILLF